MSLETEDLLHIYALSCNMHLNFIRSDGNVQEVMK